jgi:AraC family transcriptional regulator of adaptative response/methylated-DNA-[protein]-cysteine methyltransferase
LFKAATGVTPKVYAAALRDRRTRDALQHRATVTQAIYDAGYSSSGRFYEGADARLGMTPSAYRGGGAGTAIRFAVGECVLGSILVAQTERGVCAILLGDNPQALLDDLTRRFPQATLLGGDAKFESLIAAVVGMVENPAMPIDLPLDIRGTAFQRRVWEALRRIPAGTTATYAEIARRVGAPSATRAVAQACGANPLAVAVPCHRVVRTGGALAGYRWGIERKKTLLNLEKTSDKSTANGSPA